jgi:hypothetical protein
MAWKALRTTSAFFKEFSLGGQNRKKRQNEKYEPSRFGERASLKRDFVKIFNLLTPAIFYFKQ